MHTSLCTPTSGSMQGCASISSSTDGKPSAWAAACAAPRAACSPSLKAPAMPRGSGAPGVEGPPGPPGPPGWTWPTCTSATGAATPAASSSSSPSSYWEAESLADRLLASRSPPRPPCKVGRSSIHSIVMTPHQRVMVRFVACEVELSLGHVQSLTTSPRDPGITTHLGPLAACPARPQRCQRRQRGQRAVGGQGGEPRCPQPLVGRSGSLQGWEEAQCVILYTGMCSALLFLFRFCHQHPLNNCVLGCT